MSWFDHRTVLHDLLRFVSGDCDLRFLQGPADHIDGRVAVGIDALFEPSLVDVQIEAGAWLAVSYVSQPARSPSMGTGRWRVVHNERRVS